MFYHSKKKKKKKHTRKTAVKEQVCLQVFSAWSRKAQPWRCWQTPQLLSACSLVLPLLKGVRER